MNYLFTYVMRSFDLEKEAVLGNELERKFMKKCLTDNKYKYVHVKKYFTYVLTNVAHKVR